MSSMQMPEQDPRLANIPANAMPNAMPTAGVSGMPAPAVNMPVGQVAPNVPMAGGAGYQMPGAAMAMPQGATSAAPPAAGVQVAPAQGDYLKNLAKLLQQQQQHSGPVGPGGAGGQQSAAQTDLASKQALFGGLRKAFNSTPQQGGNISMNPSEQAENDNPQPAPGGEKPAGGGMLSGLKSLLGGG